MMIVSNHHIMPVREKMEKKIKSKVDHFAVKIMHVLKQNKNKTRVVFISNGSN